MAKLFAIADAVSGSSTSREHEQHKAEFFEEMEEKRVRLDSEGAKENTHEQHSDGSQGGSLDSYFRKYEADSYNETQHHQRMAGS